MTRGPSPDRQTTSRSIRPQIEAIAKLERETLRARTPADRLVDAVTGFIGSVPSVMLHVGVFGAWLLVNSGLLPRVPPFDPYPFNLLGVVIALEAIFLSTFVLMKQNRMSRQADQRAHLDLQVGLLSEREDTKTLQLLEAVCRRLGLDSELRDEDLQRLRKKLILRRWPQTLRRSCRRSELVCGTLRRSPPDRTAGAGRSLSA